jgi:hypothetical protein
MAGVVTPAINQVRLGHGPAVPRIFIGILSSPMALPN